MRGTEFPDCHLSRIGAEFFQHGDKAYLLIVNYYSRDVEISSASKHVNTIDTILKMKILEFQTSCSRVMDPCLTLNKFREFATDWGFQHIISSPQSYGEVERAVQTMKMILKESGDEHMALMSYRNTTLHNGYSPAQLSMGRAN